MSEKSSFHGVSRLAVFGVMVLSLAGCSGFECGVESGVLAIGSVKDASGATIATIRAEASENVNPDFYRLLIRVLGAENSQGAPLRGHVLAAKLVDEAGETLAEIPPSTVMISPDGVTALTIDLPSTAEYSRFRSALLTGKARVIIETDLASSPSFDTSLSEAHEIPRDVGNCSPT